MLCVRQLEHSGPCAIICAKCIWCIYNKYFFRGGLCRLAVAVILFPAGEEARLVSERRGCRGICPDTAVCTHRLVVRLLVL